MSPSGDSVFPWFRIPAELNKDLWCVNEVDAVRVVTHVVARKPHRYTGMTFWVSFRVRRKEASKQTPDHCDMGSIGSQGGDKSRVTDTRPFDFGFSGVS